MSSQQVQRSKIDMELISNNNGCGLSQMMALPKCREATNDVPADPSASTSTYFKHLASFSYLPLLHHGPDPVIQLHACFAQP